MYLRTKVLKVAKQIFEAYLAFENNFRHARSKTTYPAIWSHHCEKFTVCFTHDVEQTCF